MYIYDEVNYDFMLKLDIKLDPISLIKKKLSGL